MKYKAIFWTALLACLPSCSLSAVAVSGVKQDYWMGVYKGSTKIGYTHVVIKPRRLGDRDVLCKDESVLIRVKKSKETDDIRSTHTTYVSQVLSPVLETVHMVNRNPAASGPRSVQMEYRFGRDTYDITITHDGGTASRSYPLTAEDKELLETGYAYDFGVTRSAVGKRISTQRTYLRMEAEGDGFEWKCEPVGVEALRQERLKMNGTRYDTVVVCEKGKSGCKTFKWFLENGEIVKQTQGSIVFVRETKAKAMSGGK